MTIEQRIDDALSTYDADKLGMIGKSIMQPKLQPRLIFNLNFQIML